jgi:hypothetical protein
VETLDLTGLISKAPDEGAEDDNGSDDDNDTRPPVTVAGGARFEPSA